MFLHRGTAVVRTAVYTSDNDEKNPKYHILHSYSVSFRNNFRHFLVLLVVDGHVNFTVVQFHRN